MATSKLSAVAIAKITRPGIHGDGGGLWLQVTPTGGKSWSYRFMLSGKAREMGLGPYPTVTLAEARIKAGQARRLLADGRDPIEVRNAERVAAALATARSVTFKQCAVAYIDAHKGGWKNAKHAAQWPSTLEAYAYPIFGDLPVQSVDVGLVMKAVEPIWTTKTETASRLRGRIESVLDWARVREYRTGENPARWKGHLQNLLPAAGKVSKVEHHAALPWQEIGAFMATLRAKEVISSFGLQFLILTACRTGEVIGARWEEIDLQGAVWTVPAARMKAGVELRVPLSAPALALLKGLAETRQANGCSPVARRVSRCPTWRSSN